MAQTTAKAFGTVNTSRYGSIGITSSRFRAVLRTADGAPVWRRLAPVRNVLLKLRYFTAECFGFRFVICPLSVPAVGSMTQLINAGCPAASAASSDFARLDGSSAL